MLFRSAATQAIPQEEIERARRYLVGALLSDQQQAASRANAMVYAERYGLDGLRYRQQVAAIEAITPEQLQSCAQRLKAPLAVVRVLPEAEHG